MAFVFFDVETTGLDTNFDQIVQFAALRTDNDLETLDEVEERSRLLPHVMPHPRALAVNGLPISKLIDPNIPSHYTTVRKLLGVLAEWSPAIFLGYNSINFDEKLLRQAFYQTLHDPYFTSRHGNARTDVLSLALAAWACTPSCLTVPVGPNGRPTFKLELLASANGVKHDRAHDAMADVKATLEICRIVRDRAPDVWNRFVRFSNKASVRLFVEDEESFWLAEFFGNEAYHSAVTCIGTDPADSNVRLCLSLAHEPAQLELRTDDELSTLLHARPSPIRRIRVNAAPAIASLDDAPDGLIELPLDVIDARASYLRENTLLQRRLVDAYVRGRPPWPESPHVEGQMVSGGFIEEGARRAAFHDAAWPDRVRIVEGFDDPRLRQLGRRLIYMERRSILPDSIRREVERDLTSRLMAPETLPGGALSIPQALAVTEAEISASASTALDDYHEFLRHRHARARDFIARSLEGGAA